MWPFDQNEEEQDESAQPNLVAANMPASMPAPQQPPASAPAQPSMNPQVKDYLAQKYGLDQYSPEKRKEIEDENAADREGPNWLAGIAALGAGLQGRDAGAAGQSFLKTQEAGRKGKLDAFDKERAVTMQNVNDKDMLAKREAESDPNSPESKSAQELALKLGMRPETAGKLTAAKFKELAPTLSKAYAVDEGIKVRDDQNSFNREKLASDDRLRRDLALMKESQKGLQLTPGQQALDKTFAKEYDEWSSGGEASVDKNLQRLKEAKAKIASAKDDMFGTSGPITGRLPSFLRGEESKTIQQDVQAAAQGALKATLGAQFTEKEGERIMNMAYDPTLSPAANMKKIDLAINELETGKLAKNAKATHFEKNGTLTGLAKQDIPRPDNGKKVVQQFRSKSTGKTKLVYDDGSSEVVNEAVANNGK